jgi:hypothetical protein
VGAARARRRRAAAGGARGRRDRAARRSGPAALRIARLAAERRKSDDASLREILEATAKFLANPGEIAVTANPPPGISLFMLSLLVFISSVLRLSVLVN